MNSTWKKRAIFAAPVAALALLGLTATAQAAPTPVPLPTQTTIDSAVAARLTYLRQEEQLARDVYTALAARYDQAAPFTNIVRSEQRHFDAIGRLLQAYGITDPAVGHAAGSYADDSLQNLYATLIRQGNESLAGAYQVGITIETTDIADLKSTTALPLPADVKTALVNLEKGSNSHLAAFTAAKNGQTPATHSQNGRATANGQAATKRAGQGDAYSRRGQGNGQGQGQRGNGQHQANRAGR